MEREADIEASIRQYFLLWQRQITLMAQQPDSSAETLLRQAEVLAEKLKLQDPSGLSDD